MPSSGGSSIKLEATAAAAAKQVKMGTGLGCGSRTLEELSSFYSRKVSTKFLGTSTITIAHRLLTFPLILELSILQFLNRKYLP